LPHRLLSLESATSPEGAGDEGQPPQVSCHTGCLNAMVSWPALRHGRQAREHPGGAYQRHRGQPEHPACLTAPRQCPTAPNPQAVSNAVRGGSTTPTSWRRYTCCPRQMSCCLISPCRRWCSSWMAAV